MRQTWKAEETSLYISCHSCGAARERWWLINIYISYAWQTGKVLQRKNPVTHSLPKRYPASQLVVSIWSHSLDYASRGDWVVMIQEIVEEKIV
jgi:hypothetical protein